MAQSLSPFLKISDAPVVKGRSILEIETDCLAEAGDSYFLTPESKTAFGLSSARVYSQQACVIL
jgi:hypothetical protein